MKLPRLALLPLISFSILAAGEPFALIEFSKWRIYRCQETNASPGLRADVLVTYGKDLEMHSFIQVTQGTRGFGTEKITAWPYHPKGISHQTKSFELVFGPKKRRQTQFSGILFKDGKGFAMTCAQNIKRLDF